MFLTPFCAPGGLASKIAKYLTIDCCLQIADLFFGEPLEPLWVNQWRKETVVVAQHLFRVDQQLTVTRWETAIKGNAKLPCKNM